jgi:hypothetical protein
LLFKDVLVENSAIALVPAVKGIHVAVGPRRAQSADDRFPNLFMESVSVCKNNGRRGGCNRRRRRRERGGATVGVACESEGRGGCRDNMADDVESGADS